MSSIEAEIGLKRLFYCFTKETIKVRVVHCEMKINLEAKLKFCVKEGSHNS